MGEGNGPAGQRAPPKKPESVGRRAVLRAGRRSGCRKSRRSARKRSGPGATNPTAPGIDGPFSGQPRRAARSAEQRHPHRYRRGGLSPAACRRLRHAGAQRAAAARHDLPQPLHRVGHVHALARRHLLRPAAAGERRLRPDGDGLCAEHADGPAEHGHHLPRARLSHRLLRQVRAAPRYHLAQEGRELQRCARSLWLRKLRTRRRQDRRTQPGLRHRHLHCGRGGSLDAHARPRAQPARHPLASRGELHLAARHHVRRRQPARPGRAEIADGRKDHAAARQLRLRHALEVPAVAQRAGAAGQARPAARATQLQDRLVGLAGRDSGRRPGHVVRLLQPLPQHGARQRPHPARRARHRPRRSISGPRPWSCAPPTMASSAARTAKPRPRARCPTSRRPTCRWSWSPPNIRAAAPARR